METPTNYILLESLDMWQFSYANFVAIVYIRIMWQEIKKPFQKPVFPTSCDNAAIFPVEICTKGSRYSILKKCVCDFSYLFSFKSYWQFKVLDEALNRPKKYILL